VLAENANINTKRLSTLRRRFAANGTEELVIKIRYSGRGIVFGSEMLYKNFADE
jgi:hypothetical protein